MRRTVFVSLLGVCLLGLVFAVEGQAQSVDCANPTSVIADGRLNSSSIPAGAVFWFAVSSSQAVASYSVEANFPQGAGTMPELAVLAAPCPGSAVTTRDTTGLTPEAPNGQRLSFLKTTGLAATFLIRVENPGAGSEALTLRVSETTQVSPRWSTFGGFYTTWGFTNTTNAPIDVMLQVIGSGSPTPVATASFEVGAGEAVFRDTRPTDLNVGPNQAGSVRAIHNGPPGAVLADGFMSNESGVVFVVIPVKFTEVRAGAASGGGEGMAMGGGDITAVNTAAGSGLEGGAATGDVNLSLMTCPDPQILKRSGSAWVCADDLDTNSGGTVTSIAAGAGLAASPLNPIMTAGTLSVDTSVIQSRVSGVCGPGSAIRSIDANGTVICEPAGMRVFGPGSLSLTIPTGVNFIVVEAWGGGGGGGGAVLSAGSGGGGGGGAYVLQVLQVAPGQVLNINVGTGGTGGLGDEFLAGNGGVGGSTSITGPVSLAAGGGQGGSAADFAIGGFGGLGGTFVASASPASPVIRAAEGAAGSDGSGGASGGASGYGLPGGVPGKGGTGGIAIGPLNGEAGQPGLMIIHFSP